MNLLRDIVRGGLMMVRDRLRLASGEELWLAMAQRFDQIDGEVSGRRTSDDMGAWEWFLESRGNPRGFQRFKTEAAAAGRVLNGLLQGRDDDDPIDVWLNAVLEFADLEGDLVVTGRDRHRGMRGSAAIASLVEASRRLCAKLAADSPALDALTASND